MRNRDGCLACSASNSADFGRVFDCEQSCGVGTVASCPRIRVVKTKRNYDRVANLYLGRVGINE